MAQEQIQIQEQRQLQVQRLSQQQMLQVKLLEMPLTELEESVNAELDDNPALEKGREEGELSEGTDNTEAGNDDFDAQQEQQERQDALDTALERMGDDDELPVYDGRQRQDNADYEEIVYGDTTSFIDKLNEQVGERVLTERQKAILEYLIGSLDDDGLLRKELDVIADELAIYHGIDCEEQEIADTLKLLQDFDPAGIGARMPALANKTQGNRWRMGTQWQRVWLSENHFYRTLRCFHEEALEQNTGCSIAFRPPNKGTASRNTQA